MRKDRQNKRKEEFLAQEEKLQVQLRWSDQSKQKWRSRSYWWHAFQLWSSFKLAPEPVPKHNFAEKITSEHEEAF